MSDRDDQIEMLRAEIAELRQRLEIYRAAFAEGIGQHSEELAACVKARWFGTSRMGSSSWWTNALRR